MVIVLLNSDTLKLMFLGLSTEDCQFQSVVSSDVIHVQCQSKVIVEMVIVSDDSRNMQPVPCIKTITPAQCPPGVRPWDSARATPPYYFLHLTI